MFVALTALVALLTWWVCGRARHSADASKDYFLAGGGLAWPYVAGSLLLTNISAEQIVGMNGAQMMLVAWWEFGAAAGLLVLAHVLVPMYYKYNCTTTTELLERRLGDPGLRRLVSVLFLVGYMFILLPVVLYTGAVFMKSMFALDAPVVVIESDKVNMEVPAPKSGRLVGVRKASGETKTVMTLSLPSGEAESCATLTTLAHLEV